MLISFFTLILAFCIGILSGLFFRGKYPNAAGFILAWVIGAFLSVLATYGSLKVLIWLDVIRTVNPDWFIRQCVWLGVLSLIGVILAGKALRKKN